MDQDIEVEVIQTSDAGKVILANRPLIIRGLAVGPCVYLWNNVDYLKHRVSDDKRVTVHVCENGEMNFLKKNFLYKTISFHSLLDRCTSEEKLDGFFISEKEKYYLRALGDDPRKEAASFEKHFPDLAADVHLPNIFPKERLFSSVLRAGSAGVRLWTHYDVMDNILLQIVGRKRVVLFDPTDAPYLYLSGDKSEVIDVDNPDLFRYPLFAKAKRYCARLVPGDVLFIPALWFHNVIASDFSIAVNAFWRSTAIRDDFFDAKDMYGNSDLLPSQKAFQGLEKAMKQLDELPEPYRRFYAFRCVEMLKKKFQLSDEIPAGATCGDESKNETQPFEQHQKSASPVAANLSPKGERRSVETTRRKRRRRGRGSSNNGKIIPDLLCERTSFYTSEPGVDEKVRALTNEEMVVLDKLKRLASPDGQRKYTREFMLEAAQLPLSKMRPLFQTPSWSSEYIDEIFNLNRRASKDKAVSRRNRPISDFNAPRMSQAANTGGRPRGKGDQPMPKPSIFDQDFDLPWMKKRSSDVTSQQQVRGQSVYSSVDQFSPPSPEPAAASDPDPSRFYVPDATSDLFKMATQPVYCGLASKYRHPQFPPMTDFQLPPTSDVWTPPPLTGIQSVWTPLTTTSSGSPDVSTGNLMAASGNRQPQEPATWASLVREKKTLQLIDPNTGKDLLGDVQKVESKRSYWFLTDDRNAEK